MFIYYGLLGLLGYNYLESRNPYFEETGLQGPPVSDDIQEEIDKEKKKQVSGIGWQKWDDYLLLILAGWVVLSTKPWK